MDLKNRQLLHMRKELSKMRRECGITKYHARALQGGWIPNPTHWLRGLFRSLRTLR